MPVNKLTYANEYCFECGGKIKAGQKVYRNASGFRIHFHAVDCADAINVTITENT